MTEVIDSGGALSVAVRRRTISITALIDIVFILLLFFMLSSSFVRGNSVQLETPVSSATQSAVDAALALVLASDGTLRGAERTLDLGNYRRLDRSALRAASAGREVVVHPAPDVALQTLVSASEALLRSGVPRVSLGDLAMNQHPEQQP